jgi:hypothetical protein
LHTVAKRTGAALAANRSESALKPSRQDQSFAERGLETDEDIGISATRAAGHVGVGQMSAFRRNSYRVVVGPFDGGIMSP